MLYKIPKFVYSTSLDDVLVVFSLAKDRFIELRGAHRTIWTAISESQTISLNSLTTETGYASTKVVAVLDELIAAEIIESSQTLEELDVGGSKE